MDMSFNEKGPGGPRKKSEDWPKNAHDHGRIHVPVPGVDPGWDDLQGRAPELADIFKIIGVGATGKRPKDI